MKSEAIKLSTNRMNHMLQVARTAQELSQKLFGWTQDKCRRMFLLGYLHDIGYEYATRQSDHPKIGGLILKESGYEYWREVYWHGQPGAPYKSDELLILNLADNMTDASGNAVTLQERLLDIETRYGKDSIQLNQAAALHDELRCSLKEKNLALSFYRTGNSFV